MKLFPHPHTEKRNMTEKMNLKRLMMAGLVLGLVPTAQAATVDFDPTGEFAAQFDGTSATYTESATGGLNGSVGINLANVGVANFDGSQSESLTIAAAGDAITVGAFINFSSFGTTDNQQSLRLGLTKGGADNFAFLPFSGITVVDASEGTFRLEERDTTGGPSFTVDATTFNLSTGSWYYFEATFGYDGDTSADFDLVIANATATGTIGSTIRSWSVEDGVAMTEFTTGAELYGGFKGSKAFDGAAAVIDNFYVSNTGASQIPEPGSLALLGLGGMLVAARRRRQA